MEKEVCDQIINNISKRYQVIDKYWYPDLESCTVEIKLPNNVQAKFIFDITDNTLYSDAHFTIPFDEKLRISYFSKDYGMYMAEVYLKRENGNLVYRFDIGEKYGTIKDQNELMQGLFIDEILKKLEIENL